MTSAGSSACGTADELKARGNAHFQKGQLDDAIASYRYALDALNNTGSGDAGSVDALLKPTLLANIGLVHLKRGRDQTDATSCITACDEAIECLDAIPSSSAASGPDRRAQLRCKALYRRARGRVASAALSTSKEDEVNTCLNAAARDLLDVLKIDPSNREAAALLAVVRERHGQSRREGGSDMAKALAGLATSTGSNNGNTKRDDQDDIDKAVDHSLKMIMGLLTRDVASAAMEMGRRGGVSQLMQVATNANRRHGQHGQHGEAHGYSILHRVLALHALSAACSHGPFVRQYACPNALDQEELAHLISESCGGAAVASGTNSAGAAAAAAAERPQQIAVAAIALFLRLAVHLDHTDEKMVQSVHDVNGSSICRAIISGLSAPLSEDSTTCHRASIDLLSAWTASDMDALASAAEASDVYLESAANNSSSQQKNRLSEAQMNNLKPKEFAQYKKKMYEIHKQNQDRAKQNAILFCDMETGGLTALLDCAVSTSDHSLRREIGSAIGRLVASFEEDEDVMKLISPLLGYTGSIPSSSEGEGEAPGTSNDMLTIEEIKEGDEESKEAHAEATNKDDPLGSKNKRGQLVSALLLGKGEVGVWALKSGWADGNGMRELEELVSSKDSLAMSIASEIISAAASIEKGRPLLTSILERGCIETLLASDSREVRSGAASAIAKLGLANKDLSADEGEVFGLLQIAAELVTGTSENDEQLIQKTNKIKRGNGTNSASSSDSTAIDRGVEVLSYLCSKTNIKEEIAHGFKAQSASNSILERLVELGSAPDAGEAHSAYGLATIFSLIAVSNQTLRDEAFAKADITSEQYDQLQAMGKTEEEKELDKKQQDLDPKDAVSERIVRMANANVPRAVVKLMEGSSEATKEMLVVGMNRMAVEQTVRGLMIQQGCLSACLKVEKSESPSDIEKKTWHQARHCVAKLLVTTNPGLLTVSQRMGSIGPLIQLIHDHESTDLSRFEALMAITNLASLDEETKNRVIAEKGIARLGYAMFSDHEMVRRAATEAMSNLIPHPEMMKYLADPENIRLWVAFAREFDENLECSRAAIGCLAMASQDPKVAEVLAKAAHFQEMATSLLECGNLELMHRILVALLNMTDHGGKCKEAVVSSGCGVFCQAFAQSYHDGTMASGLNFNEQEKGLLLVTVDLAKEVSKLCEK